jgi:hypothetical protein
MRSINPFEIWLSPLRNSQSRTPSPIASPSSEVAND